MSQFFLFDIKQDRFIPVRDQMTLGRAADISFPDDDLVSRQHVRISISGDAAFVEDMNSTNKTSVQKTALKPLEKIPLRVGELLEFGTQKFILTDQDQIKPQEEISVTRKQAVIVHVTPSRETPSRETAPPPIRMEDSALRVPNKPLEVAPPDPLSHPLALYQDPKRDYDGTVQPMVKPSKRPYVPKNPVRAEKRRLKSLFYHAIRLGMLGLFGLGCLTSFAAFDGFSAWLPDYRMTFFGLSATFAFAFFAGVKRKTIPLSYKLGLVTICYTALFFVYSAALETQYRATGPESFLKRDGNCKSIVAFSAFNAVKHRLAFYPRLLGSQLEDFCRASKLQEVMDNKPSLICSDKRFENIDCYESLVQQIAQKAPLGTSGQVQVMAVGMKLANQLRKSGMDPIAAETRLIEVIDTNLEAFADMSRIKELSMMTRSSEDNQHLKFEVMTRKAVVYGNLERLEKLVTALQSEISSQPQTRTPASSGQTGNEIRSTQAKQRFERLAAEWGYPNPQFMEELKNFQAELTRRRR